MIAARLYNYRSSFTVRWENLRICPKDKHPFIPQLGPSCSDNDDFARNILASTVEDFSDPNEWPSMPQKKPRYSSGRLEQ